MMIRELMRSTRVLAIVGDILKVRASGVGYGELAMVENPDGSESLAQVIQLEGDVVSLQVFFGGRGISTSARVRFLGHAMRVTFSKNILGRIFRGSGEPMDGGPDLAGEPQAELDNVTVNPVMRILPHKMIHTRVPMIDLFNSLVRARRSPSSPSRESRTTSCWRGSAFRRTRTWSSSAGWD
jgi:V/A-type H+/Na+-transporting ATPase subunit B